MRSIPPKSLELISEFSKFIGYKANIQESIVFIYVYMYTHTYVCVCAKTIKYCHLEDSVTESLKGRSRSVDPRTVEGEAPPGL